MLKLSPLQLERTRYKPLLPPVLKHLGLAVVKDVDGQQLNIPISIAKIFPLTSPHKVKEICLTDRKADSDNRPLRVGVVLSGGQAPGGHNVICGLLDGLKELNPASSLFGFLDGPGGIVKGKYIELTEEVVTSFRNQGGFDLIGSGRTKIEKPEQLQATDEVVKSLNLDGLVVVGGDDSNTNAAVLAERFAFNGIKTCVVGVPKTIDGDLKNHHIEASFGFDTATKVYSEIIGNLMRDALSAKKYYFFVKLMGRSASHIALECALQTHPNYTLIGEEVARNRTTIKAIVNEIADLICQRAASGKNYGVILIPEGVIEFLPEFNALIKELNALLSPDQPHLAKLEAIEDKKSKAEYVLPLLSHHSILTFEALPLEIRIQLLLTRDAHGNVQVAKIETERLLIELVEKELTEREAKGQYEGSFSPQPCFCGYEGRAALPSNFDANYCYSLGRTATLLINSKANGYITAIKNLSQPVEEWVPFGVPLTTMMTVEMRAGKEKTVIEKQLVDLDGAPFAAFSNFRDKWMVEDDYIGPGPIQFFGPKEVTDEVTKTLTLEQKYR